MGLMENLFKMVAPTLWLCYMIILPLYAAAALKRQINHYSLEQLLVLPLGERERARARSRMGLMSSRMPLMRTWRP